MLINSVIHSLFITFKNLSNYVTNDRPKRIPDTFEKAFAAPKQKPSSAYVFKTLIVTTISCNEADRNVERAFEDISSNFRIAHEALAKVKKKKVRNN